MGSESCRPNRGSRNGVCVGGWGEGGARVIDGSGGCWAEWIMPFFVRAQTTQVTQLQLRACLQKICMQKTHTHGMPKLLCGFCEVCSAPCSGVILSAVIIMIPPAVLVPVVDVLNLALPCFELQELLGRFYPRSRRLYKRKCQNG